MQEHDCIYLDQDGNEKHFVSEEPSWWEHDAQGIPLCRVCDECRDLKLSHYRPEILSGYDQGDVDEDIDSDYGYGEEPW